MNWAAAAGTGFGLGLAYFGALWLNVRTLRFGSRPRALLFGRLARHSLAGVTFFGLLKTSGIVAVAVGLVGLLAARWHLFRVIGGISDGR